MKSMDNKVRFISVRAIHYFILSSIALTVIIPFLWMFSTSFKGSGVMYEIPPRWIPQKFIWANYSDTLIKNHFLRFGINSIYVSLMASIGQLFTCSLAGFAFARLKFPGRDLLFGVLLVTMMIPLQVMIIPEFLIMLGLRWIDSLSSAYSAFVVGRCIRHFYAQAVFYGYTQRLRRCRTDRRL